MSAHAIDWARQWALLTSALATRPRPQHGGGDGGDGSGDDARRARGGADDGLVERARGGDRQAFDQLFRRHVDEVYRRVTRLIGGDPDREDLVQEIFVSAYRGLPRFRGDAAFSTWLYTIVVRVVYAHLRKRRRQPLGDGQIFEQLELACGAASPEQRALEREELLRLHRMLERIKPKKRVAFVMRAVEGLSLAEIGAIVGATPAAVGQRVKHAQRELEAMLAREAQRSGSGGGGDEALSLERVRLSR